MRIIARDETQHAELAWQIAAWATPQLSAAQQTQLKQAQTQALVELARSQTNTTLPRSAAQALGLPSPTIAQALIHRLFHVAGASALSG